MDPWPKAHRRLVLEGKEQRYISRSTAELAQGLHSKGGMSSQPADDHSVLLEARLETMVGQGRGGEATALLRTVFGEERAEVVAAAFISETPSPTESPEGPEDDDIVKAPQEDEIVDGPQEDETEEGPEKNETEQDETEETPIRDCPLQPNLI